MLQEPNNSATPNEPFAWHHINMTLQEPNTVKANWIMWIRRVLAGVGTASWTERISQCRFQQVVKRKNVRLSGDPAIWNKRRSRNVDLWHEMGYPGQVYGDQVEMPCMTQVDKTWGQLKWLEQDRSQWWNVVCAYVPRAAWVEHGPIPKLSKDTGMDLMICI